MDRTRNEPDAERGPDQAARELAERDVERVLARRLAEIRAGEAARIRGLMLEQLHTVGDWPPPPEPARRAQPGELPAPANAFRTVAAQPWTTSSWYAPAASVPYSWQMRAAGYRLAALAYIRCAHPDGRRAVAIWSSGGVTEQGWPKPRGVPTVCKTCPAKGPNRWNAAWSSLECWRWRVGAHGTFPRPTTITALTAAVADPTWRTNPYVIEEAA